MSHRHLKSDESMTIIRNLQAIKENIVQYRNHIDYNTKMLQEESYPKLVESAFSSAI